MDDMIATLLRLAGRRPAVPAAITGRVRNAVHDEWLRATRRRTRGRWTAAAGTVAAAVTIAAVLLPRRPAPAPVVARVVAATVQSIAGAAAGDHGLLSDGAAIPAGESVETAQGATASLQWGGATLRLDGGTRVRLDSRRRLSLARGALFIASNNERGLVVQTPFGAVTDIGTQFEVRLTAERLRVRVREGRVDLRAHSAAAGMELEADAASVVERPVPRSGSDWDWIVRAAPPIRLEGKHVREIADAAAREKGLSVVWPTGTRDTVLHGNVPLAPDEALDAALTASGLKARTAGEQLVIERKR